MVAKLDLPEVMDLYLERFGSLPTIMGINAERAKMAEVLAQAVKGKKPLSDKEWYRALGIKAPPPGALT